MGSWTDEEEDDEEIEEELVFESASQQNMCAWVKALERNDLLEGTTHKKQILLSLKIWKEGLKKKDQGLQDKMKVLEKQCNGLKKLEEGLDIVQGAMNDTTL